MQPLVVLAEFGCSPEGETERRRHLERALARRPRAQVRGVRALDERAAGLVGASAGDVPAVRRRAAKRCPHPGR